MSTSSEFPTTSNPLSDPVPSSSSTIPLSNSTSISTQDPFTVYTSTLYYSLNNPSDSPSYSIIISTASSSDVNISTALPSTNGTGLAADSAESTAGSDSYRLAIILGVILGCLVLICLLVGMFCYYQRTRRKMPNMAERNGVVDSVNGSGQRGRLGRHLLGPMKGIQETNGPNVLYTAQTARNWPATDQTQDLAGRQARGHTLSSIYSTWSHTSTSQSHFLPSERPSSNASSRLSSNGKEPQEDRAAIPMFDATSILDGLSAPSTTSTEKRALRQLSLPESWGRQVTRMEMSLEQKRAQEKFLILPEPAYSAEGLNGIRGLGPIGGWRLSPPKEDQG